MVYRAIITWILLVGTLLGGQKVVVVVDDSGSMADRVKCGLS